MNNPKINLNGYGQAALKIILTVIIGIVSYVIARQNIIGETVSAILTHSADQDRQISQILTEKVSGDVFLVQSKMLQDQIREVKDNQKEMRSEFQRGQVENFRMLQEILKRQK